MSDHVGRAGRWLDGVVGRSVRVKRLAALWHAMIGLGFCAFWWVAVVGTLYGLWFVLAFAGIGLPKPYWFGVGVYLFQFGLFPLVRRPEPQRWEVAHAVDGEVCAIPPDHTNAGNYAYNQDHDFSFRRAYVSVFFAAPIAFDEAWRDGRDAARLKCQPREPAARLAAVLLTEQKRLSFAELEHRWRSTDLKDALAAAAELPGFKLFSSEPQGVALTESAIDELLAA